MKALLVGLFATVVLTHRAEAARVPDPDPEQGDGRVSAFYTWTDEIPSTPGQMLRTEPLEARLGLNNAGQQVRILYSSTDGVDGKTPVVVSGEFFVPKGAPPAGGWPVLAWAHGTTGMADICAPSWQPHFVPENNYLARISHTTQRSGLLCNSMSLIRYLGRTHGNESEGRKTDCFLPDMNRILVAL